MERAEELIARAWTQRKHLVESGRVPTGVVVSKLGYNTIQSYHRSLGFLPDGVRDYITRYTLFDLPFLIDEGEECRVLDESP